VWADAIPSSRGFHASRVLSEAVVTGHFGLDIEVSLEGGERQRVRVRRGQDPVVVGDVVDISERGAAPRPRRTVLARRDARNRTRAIAANLDVLGVTVASEPPAPSGYVDRAIVAARAAGIEPFLVVNKCDVRESAALAEAMRDEFARSEASVPVFPVSAKTGEGLDGLRFFFSSGPVRGAFVGTSGVGKSSLLNALVPGIDLPTGEINRFTRLGRHVTTVSTLHVLPSGGELIDTPGFRDFVPVDLSPADLAAHFAGFETALAAGCRFRDCRHRDEPDCSVARAVADGEIAAARHDSYLALLADLERAADRLAKGARS
jgi:ribosome biogenesis GTPase